MDLYKKTLRLLVLAIFVGKCMCHCPDAWTYFQGSCYLFGRDLKTFTEAEHYCRQHNSHLVKIETNKENSFIKSVCSHLIDTYHWIGLTDTDIEGIWRWQDGTEANFTDWYPGDPSGYGKENCVVLYQPIKFIWADDICSRLAAPICETPEAGSEVVVVG